MAVARDAESQRRDGAISFTMTSDRHTAGLAAGLQGTPADSCPHTSGSARTEWLRGHTEGTELAAGIAADRAKIAALASARSAPQPLPGTPVPPPWAQQMPHRSRAK